MAITDAQKRATKKYISKNNLVEIKCRVTLDERTMYYEQIKCLGYNINQFLKQAIEEKIERESKNKTSV